eukprot:SAG31_NODE_21620_length_545_cov_0.852018_1_plen_164_part_10
MSIRTASDPTTVREVFAVRQTKSSRKLKQLCKRMKAPATISLMVTQMNMTLFVPDSDKELISLFFNSIGAWTFVKDSLLLKFTGVESTDKNAFDLQVDSEQLDEIVRLMTEQAAGLGKHIEASAAQTQQRNVLMEHRRGILDTLVSLLNDDNTAIHMSAESAIV